jgi:hypothetical protein
MEKHRLTRPQITPAVAWGNSHLRLLGSAELLRDCSNNVNKMWMGQYPWRPKLLTIKTGGFMRVSIKVV